MLRFQLTTAPTNRGWSACGLSSEASQTEEDFFSLPARTLSCYSLVMTFKDLSNLHLISYDDSLIDDGEFIVLSDLYYSILKAFSSSRSFCFFVLKFKVNTDLEQLLTRSKISAAEENSVLLQCSATSCSGVHWKHLPLYFNSG